VQVQVGDVFIGKKFIDDSFEDTTFHNSSIFHDAFGIITANRHCPTLHHRRNLARLKFRLDCIFAHKNCACRSIRRVSWLMHVIEQDYALAKFPRLPN
jgi:hypothetical protein